jgi:hypothetical protein
VGYFELLKMAAPTTRPAPVPTFHSRPHFRATFEVNSLPLSRSLSLHFASISLFTFCKPEVMPHTSDASNDVLNNSSSNSATSSVTHTGVELHTPLELPCGLVLANRVAKAALTECIAHPVTHAPNDSHVSLYRFVDSRLMS